MATANVRTPVSGLDFSCQPELSSDLVDSGVVLCGGGALLRGLPDMIQRETDMQFLKRLALRNGYECFVEGERGYFRPPQVDAPTQPVVAVHFGDETNVSRLALAVNALAPVAGHHRGVIGRNAERPEDASDRVGQALRLERQRLGGRRRHQRASSSLSYQGGRCG